MNSKQVVRMKNHMGNEHSGDEMNNHDAVVTENTALCFQRVAKSDSLSRI